MRVGGIQDRGVRMGVVTMGMHIKSPMSQNGADLWVTPNQFSWMISI